MKKFVGKISKFIIFLSLFFLLGPLLVYSSPLILTKEDLIKGADSIVVGKVLDESSNWDPSGKFIVSYVKVMVVDDVKGAEAGNQEVVIKRIGGIVGNREMVVHGAPKFRNGEKALLFLKKNVEGFRTVFGMKFGKIGIIKDQISGEEIAVNSGSGVNMLMKNANGYGIGSPDVWEPRILKDLIDDIKKELDGSKTSQ